MRSPISLHIAGVDQRSWSFPLIRDVVLIGRHPNCDLNVLDRFASRYHARIEHNKPGWHIVDKGSRNGTFLNGERISEATLAIGDTLKIGHTTMVVTKGTEEGPVSHPDDEDNTPLDREHHCPATLNGQLTEKQTEVLTLLRSGLSQKEIAVKLHRSEHTVHTHVERIFVAFGVHSHPELMARIRPGGFPGKQ